MPTFTPAPATPTPTLPDVWQPVAQVSPLQIEEVGFRGSDAEFVALLNTSDQPLDLSGWRVGDAQRPGVNEGIHRLPDGYILPPGGLFIAARDGAAFQARWGQLPQAQFQESSLAVPVLPRERALASGKFALNDRGDEVVLLTPDGRLADALAYGQGDGADLGLQGSLAPVADFTLQRTPGFTFPGQRDQRHRFLWAPGDPGGIRSLPAATPAQRPVLAQGLLPAWGSLGSRTNFTPGFTAPPHYLAASAGAAGLDFLALVAPPESWPLLPSGPGAIPLRAWSWTGSGGQEALVYGAQPTAADSPDALLAWLAAGQGLAQWRSQPLPKGSPLIALPGDGLAVPQDLPALAQGWRSAGAPLLPAGNSLPPLPGIVEPAPRFTGLAVRALDEPGIMEALAARRGWLTDTPGLWITLRTEGREQVWMGQSIAPANRAPLVIEYGDRSGQVAGLTLWQDQRPIARLDTPPPDGRWRVEAPAIPGSFLYAVATQADGGFGVTAPIQVRQEGQGRVLLNELLPDPGQDWNGDGQVDSYDEFIELINLGPSPVSLAGWQLTDDPVEGGELEAASRFTFQPGDYLGVGERLVIWRRRSRISLNNDGDAIALVDDQGRVVDRASWQQNPGKDRSLSRAPDGEAWRWTQPSPGQPNPEQEAAPPGGSGGEPQPTPPPRSQGAPPGTPGGEAVGPPGSLAAAKLAGLEQRVRFVAVVTVPPGLFNASMYVADPAPSDEGLAWLGIQVYSRSGLLPPLQEGDRVDIQGVLHSFRGELEVLVDGPEQVWRIREGRPLRPLPVQAQEIGESLEGRLVTFTGVVTGWRRDSLFLADPAAPQAEPVQVTVRSSLSWRRPFVELGEVWQVTGVVSQFARRSPWNGGYRVLPRYPEDLTPVQEAP